MWPLPPVHRVTFVSRSGNTEGRKTVHIHTSLAKDKPRVSEDTVEFSLSTD
jgi:hypothetical protein